MRLFKSFLQNARGATAIEYGLLAALISVALIGGVGTFSNALGNIFSTIGNAFTDAGQ